MNESARKEMKIGGMLVACFAALYCLPVETARFQGALVEAFRLAKWYAREHVMLCLVPAFFIAGAIGVFVSRNAVMRYFGPTANKWLSYGVASVSGTILAVCSCTVLPLFGGIYMRGAGLGPAIAFLYSGPAINVLAIVLTARVLGWQLGVARAVGAVTFSVVIGALMHLVFRKEERARTASPQDMQIEDDGRPPRPLWQTAVYFLGMAAVLVFANWARPVSDSGVWHAIYSVKWPLTAGFGLLTAFSLWRFMGVKLWHLLASVACVGLVAALFPAHPAAPFTAGMAALSVLMFHSTPEMREWRDQTWSFAKQITPLLLGGVLAAGFLLGSPETVDAGLVPNRWIQALVGNSPAVFWNQVLGNADPVPGWLVRLWPLWTNLFASVTGALMYFATLTEVPILRGLMDSGMGRGPALALLLAGPALSLPSMLVINSIIGPRKTLVYVGLVVIMATVTGMVFGAVSPS